MPIRLNIPKSVRLYDIIQWTYANDVPVLFQEIKITANTMFINKTNGRIFARRRYERTKKLWLDKHDLRVMPYDARKSLGFSDFQLLVRPRDEVLLTVRFGLSRVVC